jgi:hypothetical protein
MGLFHQEPSHKTLGVHHWKQVGPGPLSHCCGRRGRWGEHVEAVAAHEAVGSGRVTPKP